MILRLAWRNIWRNRRRTLITAVSIGFGLAFALFFISLAQGVYAQLIDQAVRMQAGHITLENPEYRTAPAVDLFIDGLGSLRAGLNGLPEVESTKALVLGQGIAKSGAGNVAAALMGVEPSVEASTSPLVRNIIEGRYLDDDDGPVVVVGSELAIRLNLKVGKKLVITSNDVNADLVEELCRVKGIFKTGSEELDAYFIQMPVNFARKLFNMPDGAATQLGVILRNADTQKETMAKVKDMVSGRNVAVLPWQKVLPEVASYIKMDEGSNFIFQGILIFLVLFTIFNTLLMSVLERQREFAVLLAIGTHPSLLRSQIVMECMFLGLIGCGIGVVLGGTASWLAQIYGIDISAFLKEGVSISGFAIDTRMRARLTLSLVLVLSGLVFGATMLLSLIPMRKAANVNVVDQLR